jgi:hypothetical protein
MAIDPTDKLSALRRLDQFRKWSSLNDRRRCLRCGRIIKGEEIELVGGERGCGPLRARCPTDGCDSIPLDWVLLMDADLFGAHSDGQHQQGGVAV